MQLLEARIKETALHSQQSMNHLNHVLCKMYIRKIIYYNLVPKYF